MVQTCSAYGCKNRYHKDKDVSFHKFPLARPDVCSLWVSAMRKTNFKPTKYSNICSQHFTQESFKRECNNRVLKENAVPSLFTFNLSIKSESLDPFLHFPLSLPLPSDPVLDESDPVLDESDPVLDESDPVLDESDPVLDESDPVLDESDPVLDESDPVLDVRSCDHNYTAEDSAQQRKQLEHLEEQVQQLKKKLKSSQQKVRRQARLIQRLKASQGVTDAPGYVVLRASQADL